MPPFLKFIAVLIIWVMSGVITILQSVVNDGAGFNWIFSIVLFGISAGVTAIIMLSDQNSGKNTAMMRANTDEESSDFGGKRKNDQAGGLDMMSLLTAQDLEELREDIKDRLRERILSGQDGELSSLDSLLADQHKQRK